MHIFVRGRKRGDVKHETRRRAYVKVRAALGRFVGIDRVELRLEDLGDESGSRSKRCVAQCTLANGERLDVEQKHTLLPQPACTIQRLRQTLRRRRDGSAKIGGIARTTT